MKKLNKLFWRKTCPAVAALSMLGLILSILVFCGDQSANPDEQFQPKLSGCKNGLGGTALSSGDAFNQDCVLYDFTGGTLLIKHYNAAFNCCSGAVFEVEIKDDVIIISEADDPEGDFCHCLCLFDYEYQITNLQASQYTIKIVEPYRIEEDPAMEFTLDFAAEKSGTVCYQRTAYPWDTWSAETIGHSDCGGYEQGFPKKPAADESCAIYAYDESGNLSIRHTNAVFNCCPEELTANISIEGNLIFIEEMENLESGGCDCICPFDLDYVISSLPPAQYTIKFIEPYLGPGEDTLSFTIDLVEQQSGSFCVPREINPL